MRLLVPVALAVPASLLASMPAAAAQAPDATVLLRGASFGAATATSPVVLSGLTQGADYGWAVNGLVDLGSSQFQTALFGDLTPTGIGGAQVLRTPTTIGGYAQSNLLGPSTASGRLAYIESLGSNLGSGGRSVWLDDQRMASAGDPIGATGNTWTRFRSIKHLANGDSFVRGQFTRAQGLGTGVVRFPGEDVILATGDVIPGLPSSVGIVRKFTMSPGGAHWIAEVAYGSPLMEAIVVDGSVYELGGGFPALEGGSVPTSIAGPGASFLFFERMAINDSGDVALSAWISTPVSSGPFNIRGDRRVDPAPPSVAVSPIKAIDPRGFVATIEDAIFVGVDGIAATGPGTSVDVDGDGAVDPGWSVRLPLFVQGLEISSDGTQLLWLVQLRGPGAQQPFAVVRPERYGVAQPICAGRVNSAGGAAHVTAIGSRDVLVDELAVQCIELPSGSPGLFLASTAAGFTPNPGGSVGDLCLAGSIGRYAQAAFITDETGRAVLALDLTAIPQPMGAVSASAGSTWYFQTWYRDNVSGAQVSNLSDAVAVQLR